MTDFVYNVSKGRWAEFFHRVDQNDPANAVLVVAVLNVTGDQDAAMIDVDTLAALTGLANVAEVTTTNYARIILDDTDIDAVAADDANNRMDEDLADQTFSAIAAGDPWTDFFLGYDSDSLSGNDTNIVPISNHDFAVTPDGSDITAQINTLLRAA